MKKKLALLLMLVLVMLVTFAPQIGAYSSACEEFASRAVLGTHSSVGLALDCLASSLWDFLDIVT